MAPLKSSYSKKYPVNAPKEQQSEETTVTCGKLDILYFPVETKLNFCFISRLEFYCELARLTLFSIFGVFTVYWCFLTRRGSLFYCGPHFLNFEAGWVVYRKLFLYIILFMIGGFNLKWVCTKVCIPYVRIQFVMCHRYVIVFCLSVSLTNLSARGVTFRKRILCDNCDLLVPSLRRMLLFLGKLLFQHCKANPSKLSKGNFVDCVSAFGFSI